MRICFSINYHTRWGESLCLTPAGKASGESYHLQHTNGDHWHVTVESSKLFNPGEEYRYSVVDGDGNLIRSEWRSHVMPDYDVNLELLEICDHWIDMPEDKSFYSSLFTNVVNRRENPVKAPGKIGVAKLVIEAEAPMVAPDQILAVSGSCEALGSWNPEKALKLSDEKFPLWIGDTAFDSNAPFEYKFLILEKATGRIVAWENSNNHYCAPLRGGSATTAMVLAGSRPKFEIALWRGAGTAVPVFSLRSEDDFGCGDFLDLIPFADWAVSTGQKVIQLLPINDTTMTGTWTDSYPYNANSTFALHPLYLRPQAAGSLRSKERMDYYENLRKELQQLPAVDYERVTRAKDSYMRELYAEIAEELISSPDYNDFVTANAKWLTPYAAFCVLRNRYGTPDMSKWGEYATYNPTRIAAFVDANITEIQYVFFLQYELDRQLRTAVDYARTKGVGLKGDIPIGISRTSVDAWLNPKLYNLDVSAGAPPDDFSVLGQNWGFPTYNWEVMSNDGFAWWKSRFRKMAEYFDAYRIDHVLGFFRIWQIPLSQIQGLLGIFYQALPFTPGELADNYDFHIEADRHAKPYIVDWVLDEIFGDKADKIKESFLDTVGDGEYRLKPQFATQRQIADYFKTLPEDESNSLVCEGLMTLVADLLFIEDPKSPGTYHPRISARNTYSYRALNDYERSCYDRLYDDFFYRRNDAFWREKAMWKLPPIIDATGMLTCAEDLGMIPACVPSVMSELQMLSLEIQRMPKDPAMEFGNTFLYPYLSVCTTSTHDMPGIRGWWEENRAKTQAFYNNVLHEPGTAPVYAEPWICSKIVWEHLLAPSMLCILPIQDWLSIDGKLRRESPHDEQINIPAISRHYWRYRMHITIEQLRQASDFNANVSAMIKESGRS